MPPSERDPGGATAGIRVHPPILFAVAFAAGWGLERLHPMPLGIAAGPRWTAAGALIGAGLLLALWAVLLFRRARTGIPVHHPVTQLVTHGPYRWSRNPIYLGLVLAHVGAAIGLDMAWPVVLLPPAVVALHVLVIRREEALLQRLFGAAYRDYAARVRRWF